MFLDWFRNGGDCRASFALDDSDVFDVVIVSLIEMLCQARTGWDSQSVNVLYNHLPPITEQELPCVGVVRLIYDSRGPCLKTKLRILVFHVVPLNSQSAVTF